jgi:hypothetical protein
MDIGRSSVLRTISRPLAGTLVVGGLGIVFLGLGAALPVSVEQAVLTAAGVVLVVSSLLALGVLGLGRLLRLDERAAAVTTDGRRRVLLPALRPPRTHWVRPSALPAAATPEPATSEPATSEPAAPEPAASPVDLRRCVPLPGSASRTARDPERSLQG